MTRCNEVLERIYEYLNAHDLTPQTSLEIQQHLKECRHCYSRYEFEKKLLERAKKAECCCCPGTLLKKIKGLLETF